MTQMLRTVSGRGLTQAAHTANMEADDGERWILSDFYHLTSPCPLLGSVAAVSGHLDILQMSSLNVDLNMFWMFLPDLQVDDLSGLEFRGESLSQIGSCSV